MILSPVNQLLSGCKNLVKYCEAMPATAQNLLDAARQSGTPLDALASAIIQAVTIHQKSRRWVSAYLKENGFSISHVSISHYLKKVKEDWKVVLHTALTTVHSTKKSVEIRRLSADCSAFRLPDGTFWVPAPYSATLEDFQQQVRNHAAQTSYAVRIQDSSSGLWVLPT